MSRIVDRCDNTFENPVSAVGAPEISISGRSLFKLCFFRAGIFLISLFWFGIFAPLGLDFHHDGMMIIPALRVASGGVVFRDVFCQYGLLSPLLQGFSLWAGGTELLVMKYFSVLFYAGIAVMLDVIWSRLLSLRWRWLIFLMYWGLMPDTQVTFHAWSSIFALFFSLFSLWFLLRYFERERWLWLIFSGIAAGLTFLSRHPVGVVTAIAMFGGLFFKVMLTVPQKSRFRIFIKISALAVAGFSAVLLISAIYLICCGAWDDFVLQCVTFVFKFVHKRGSRGSWIYLAESLCPLTSELGFFALLPMITLAWLFIGVRRAAREKVDLQRNLAICVMSIFALGAWHQYYPVPCVRHLFWGGVPFFGFWVLSFRGMLSDRGKYRKICRIAAVMLFLHFAVLCSVRLYSGMFRLKDSRRRVTVDIPGIRGMKLTRGEYAMVSGVCTVLNKLPENIRARGVLNYTEGGLWNVILPDSGFRHPQFLWMENALYPDYEAKIIEYIRKHRPVVLLSKPLWLENYMILLSWAYMGETYSLAVPAEL